MPSVGIGIITFNRCDVVADTIDRVRALTRQPDALLLVADDGSTDGTRDMLRERNVNVVTGDNAGVAWNKNRALFLLAQLLSCETVILLEDDAYPDVAGWEDDWIEAARRWGHANYGGDWTKRLGLSGSGTIDDPVLTEKLTAQCACFSREALAYCGYFDPRFRGYGHEHVEHTIRLSRAGYGAVRTTNDDGIAEFRHMLIRGGVTEKPAPTYFNQEQSDRNEALALSLIDRQSYSAPWTNLPDLHRFRAEMQAAIAAGPDSFRLHRSSTNTAVSQPPNPPQSAGRGAMPAIAAGRREPGNGVANVLPPLSHVPATVAAAPRPTAARNLAVGRPTRQSSVSQWSRAGTPDADSAGAVNGSFDQLYGFHTDEEDHPWWQVDLCQECTVNAILVHNRLDHTVIAQRAFPLSVLLSSGDMKWTHAYTFSGNESDSGMDGRPLIWRPPSPLMARYVRLQVARRSILHLVQVEVFGIPSGGA